MYVCIYVYYYNYVLSFSNSAHTFQIAIYITYYEEKQKIMRTELNSHN